MPQTKSHSSNENNLSGNLIPCRVIFKEEKKTFSKPWKTKKRGFAGKMGKKNEIGGRGKRFG